MHKTVQCWCRCNKLLYAHLKVEERKRHNLRDEYLEVVEIKSSDVEEDTILAARLTYVTLQEDMDLIPDFMNTLTGSQVIKFHNSLLQYDTQSLSILHGIS